LPIRRFLLHTLPDGFHRIRYFGFMANGHRAKNIALCRALLVDEEAKPKNASSSPPPMDKDAVDAKRVCRDCGGVMRIAELQAWLIEERGMKVSVGRLWKRLRRLGLTLKKSHCAPPNKTALMSPRRARNGVQASPI
jgi:hypothetical protein